jgi:hypothetical protein
MGFRLTARALVVLAFIIASTNAFGQTITPIYRGGTGANLATAGPGIVEQATTGSALTVSAAASGDLLIGQGTSALPLWEALTGDGSLTNAGVLSVTSVAHVTTGVLGTANGGTGLSSTDVLMRHIAFQFSNAGGALTTGLSDTNAILYTGGTLVAVYLTSPDSTSGSAIVDVLRANAAVPTSGNSIVGGSGTKPSMSSTTYGKDTSFSGWTSTTFLANDVLEINLTSVTTLKYLTVELVIQTT